MWISLNIILIYMKKIKFVALKIYTFYYNESENIYYPIYYILSSTAISKSKLETRDFIFLNLSLVEESFPFKNDLFKHEIVT